MFARIPKPVKFAKLVTRDTDPVLVQHAAFDLSDLDEMRKQGVGISTSNAENLYYDGSVDCSFDVPLDMQRGVDINDLWNEAQTVKRRMSKAQLRSVSVSRSNGSLS